MTDIGTVCTDPHHSLFLPLSKLLHRLDQVWTVEDWKTGTGMFCSWFSLSVNRWCKESLWWCCNGVLLEFIWRPQPVRVLLFVATSNVITKAQCCKKSSKTGLKHDADIIWPQRFGRWQIIIYTLCDSGSPVTVPPVDHVYTPLAS